MTWDINSNQNLPFWQTLKVENQKWASKMHTSSLTKLQITVSAQVVPLPYSHAK
jgi:hypothetical protein